MPDLRLALARPGYAGLTDREAAVLDTLVRVGSATREVLVSRVGMPPDVLAVTLQRLEALGYVATIEGDEGTYRAVAQLGG
jgi:sugar-specific transcriptional regulator TrmB